MPEKPRAEGLESVGGEIGTEGKWIGGFYREGQREGGGV